MTTEKNSFTYSYRAGQQQEDDALRKRYHLPEKAEITQSIRSAPEREEGTAVALSLTVGIVSVLIFGSGLSMIFLNASSVMRTIAGILLGLIGMAGMGLTPVFHSKFLEGMRKRNESKMKNER